MHNCLPPPLPPMRSPLRGGDGRAAVAPAGPAEPRTQVAEARWSVGAPFARSYHPASATCLHCLSLLVSLWFFQSPCRCVRWSFRSLRHVLPLAIRTCTLLKPASPSNVLQEGRSTLTQRTSYRIRTRRTASWEWECAGGGIEGQLGNSLPLGPLTGMHPSHAWLFLA